MANSYQHLLQPGRIGPLQLRNRIVLPAMDQNACTSQGLITDAVVAHYEERARGGAGLLIVETSAVAYPVGATSRHQPALSSDDCIPGLVRLAEAAHTNSAAVVVQICHHGKTARVDTMDGRDQLVPSTPVPAFKADIANLNPEELSRLVAANGNRTATHREANKDDLGQVVRAFADAAGRVQRAGLDGVEIHGGHGYLISSFLSPLYNRRADEYGGTPENRARLLVEVTTAVKQACGRRFAVLVRLDGREYGGAGITSDLAARYARLAQDAGADAIHVSAYSTDPIGPGFTDGPLPWRDGQYLDLARAVKDNVTVPVIAVGRISPDLAERTLTRGDTCDFVAMGRQLLADPDLPVRLTQGRPDLVRTCINCFVCVAENFWDASPVCAVNSRLGHYDHERQPARRARKVLVIGGGPAGMEAARVAAERGHRVVLVERQRLGGTAWLSAVTNPVNAELVRYLQAAIREAGVEIRLGVDADLTTVRSEKADAVVVATGARRHRLDVPGGDLPHVLSGDDLRGLLTGDAAGLATRGQRMLIGAAHLLRLLDSPQRIRQLSHRWMPLGQRVVVIGGGMIGLELAEFLAERGRTVTVLEPSSHPGTEMAFPRRSRAMYELNQLGVTVERETRVVEIGPRQVRYARSGQDQQVAADQVIFAGGVVPDTRLADAIINEGIETYPVGDCSNVGYIHGAIHSATEAAEQI
jgi:2,4-dienoyl-CoA reductase-like NADH-dependent reductase (Old Yellow Enzyme family)/thioredoxin reductase